MFPDENKHSIDKVIAHLHVAEKHYERGKNTGDEHFFTDVLCRCNHAFEGILREAYHAFNETAERHENISLYEIEQYLKSKNLFSERVRKLLDNYRKDWRNPSTHDHKLFFSEGEALLALMNVQAIVAVVLEQMLARFGYTMGQQIKPSASEIQKDSSLRYRVLKLLEEFSRSNILRKIYEKSGKGYSRKRPPKILLLGILEGFLSSHAPELDIDVEPAISQGLKADMLISDGNQKVIVEMKTSRFDEISKHHGLVHIKHILTKSEVKEGILFFLPETGTPLEREPAKIDPPLEVTILHPEPGTKK